MTEHKLIKVSDSELQITGALNTKTVPTVLVEFGKIHRGMSNDIRLDLGELNSIDTSGVACLVNLSVECRKNGHNLLLVNVPQAAIKLAKISDVTGLLALQ